MGKANYRQIGGPDGLLARRVEFEGNSMSAKVVNERPSYYGNWGRIPNHVKDNLQTMEDGGCKVEYVVFSYVTPIAFVFSNGEKYVPDVKYSSTTSRQQTLCRAWL